MDAWGVAATHTYDNLKSVILGRKPEFTCNPRFLDLARHFHFSIRVCTPRRANEKGKVERVIRDVESFLKINTFADLVDLNRKVGLWRAERNNRIHRTIQRTPAEALREEKLKPLPQISYKPYRHETAAISTTGFITVQSNRYSVPSSFSGMTADLFIYPQRIEVVVKDNTVATHRRLLGKHEKTELPGHREKLLATSPHFKLQRIHQLMTRMDKSLEHFITEAQKQGQDPLSVSYELFKLLKGISRETLLSADCLFQIISKRSEIGTTVVTTNLIPSQWGKVFETVTASAILDRLSMNGTFLAFDGRSYRSKQ